MTLLPLLLAGHLLGDWLIQSDFQAANKTSSWNAMSQHMLGYHLTVALFVAFSGIGLLPTVVILAVSCATHAFIDRRWPVVWLLSHTGSEVFAQTTWGVMAADQALHISILCLLAAVYG